LILQERKVYYKRQCFPNWLIVHDTGGNQRSQHLNSTDFLAKHVINFTKEVIAVQQITTQASFKTTFALVIEILSPSSESLDRVLKFNRYLQAGVREYWLLDPNSRTVSVNVLAGGRYVASAYADTDIAPVHVLEGCHIALQDVFA
jgi:hypothetical protein